MTTPLAATNLAGAARGPGSPHVTEGRSPCGATRRPFEYCDDLTPVEAERAQYAHRQAPATAAVSNWKVSDVADPFDVPGFF